MLTRISQKFSSQHEKRCVQVAYHNVDCTEIMRLVFREDQLTVCVHMFLMLRYQTTRPYGCTQLCSDKVQNRQSQSHTIGNSRQYVTLISPVL